MASKDSHVTGTNGFVVGSVRGRLQEVLNLE